MEDISDDDFINVPSEDQEYFQKFWINLTNYSTYHLNNNKKSISEIQKNADFIDENSRKKFTFKLKKNNKK